MKPTEWGCFKANGMGPLSGQRNKTGNRPTEWGRYQFWPADLGRYQFWPAEWGRYQANAMGPLFPKFRFATTLEGGKNWIHN